MMRKYQKGGKIYSYNKGSHYQPNTNNIYFNKEDDKFNPNAVLEHELYHRFQNENNGLQLPEYYNGPLKKPNMIMNDDYQNAYYNRRHVDEQNIYNKIIEKNPDLQFIPRNLLYNGYKTSSGNYIPGTEEMMYKDPTTAEGEARDYENYIRKGGKTMFPNQTINEYKSGGKWIQGAIKNPGRCTPGSPNYDCPEGSPQWRLAQTFKKHHGFHKKEDLKKYQGGGPTASDSLAVMNSQIALNKFYDNEVKKGRLKKGEDKRPITSVIFSPDYLKKLNDKNLAFYREKIKQREEAKKRGSPQTGTWDDSYKSIFNLNPSDVSRLEYQGLGKTKSSDAYRQYYRDVITPMQNLAAPFALVDSRIKPRATVSYHPSNMDYPGGNVTVYDYDPIAVKPAAMKTAADWAYMKKTYGTKPPVKLATAPITKLFDSQQSLRNTAPDYTQMLANLKEKQLEAQYQTSPRTLPAEQPYDKSNDGQVIYYKPGQRENAQTTPFVGGQNANNYIMSKYKNGGPTKLNPPIVYTDRKEFEQANKNYTDSLNLFKAYQMQDKLMGPGSRVTSNKVNPNEWTTKELLEKRKKRIVRGLENYGPIADDFQNQKEQFTNSNTGKKEYSISGRKEDEQLLNYYKSLGFTDKDIMYHSSPDIVSDKIRPIGVYFDGTAASPIYTQPVQPVVYQPQPVFNPQQSLQNTVPNYTQMSADLQAKQVQQQAPKPYGFGEARYTERKQPTVVPQKGSRPFYGPGNTIIGYSDDNMQFYPAQQYTGAPNNPINLQDKELLENPEVLKKYVQSRDSYKFAEGGPFISNSQKINLNLPVYKQPEMKPLQFNKFFVNDKNQNLYIGGVNPRYQNKDFSVGPYMVGVGNTNFQKLPADIGMSGTYHVNDKFDINTNIGQNNVGAGIKYKFAKGGIPNNPGFNALPKYVQKRIINNYKQGGVILNTGGEKHEIYVKTTNRGEGTKGHIMVNHPTMDKGMWDTIDLTQKAGVKTIAQGIASTKKWHKENPYMKNNKYQQGGISYNNLDDVLKRLFG